MYQTGLVLYGSRCIYASVIEVRYMYILVSCFLNGTVFSDIIIVDL